MRNDLATAEFDLAERTGELSECQTQLASVREELEKLQRENREMKTQQNISSWLPAATAEHKESSSSAALMKLRGENAELHKQLSAIQSVHSADLAALQQRMDTQRSEIAAKEDKLKTAHAKLKEFLQTSMASVRTAQAKSAAAEARVIELEGRITEMEAQGLHPSVGSPILSPALRSTAAGAAAAAGGAMAAITVVGTKLRRRPGPKPKHVVVAATIDPPSAMEELLTEEQKRIVAASKRLGAAAAADASPRGPLPLSLDAAGAAAESSPLAALAPPALVPKRRGRPPKDPLAAELRKQGLDAASKRQKISHSAMQAASAVVIEKQARRELEKDLFGENESQTIAGSAANSPALRPSVPAATAALPKQHQDQLAIVVQAVATDWAQRLDTIDERTPLQQHPLHLLTHLLCPHLLHSPPHAAPFTLCFDRLATLLFSIFSALVRQISSDAATAEIDVWTQQDLCALSGHQGQLVHRAASQMTWALRALEKAFADSASSSAAAAATRHDVADDDDEPMHSCGSSVMSDSLPPADTAASSAPAPIAAAAAASCGCAKGSSMPLSSQVSQLAFESLLSADSDRRTPPSDAEMALECACLSLLFHDASTPSAPGTSSSSNDSLLIAADRCGLLLLDLAASRALAPLHLLEHSLAVLPSDAWTNPIPAAADMLSCTHVDSNLALFGEEACWISHLSGPASSTSPSASLCCAACAARFSSRDLVPLVWRSLLARGLASFPRQMLETHLPRIAAMLKSTAAVVVADNGEEKNSDTAAPVASPAASSPPPTPASLCSILLHRLSSFTAATPSVDLRTSLVLLRVLLVSLGSVQACYLAHHVFLPLHTRALESLEAAAAVAAGDADDDDDEPSAAAAADPTQAALWKHVLGICARQAEETMRHAGDAVGKVKRRKNTKKRIDVAVL